MTNNLLAACSVSNVGDRDGAFYISSTITVLPFIHRQIHFHFICKHLLCSPVYVALQTEQADHQRSCSEFI